MVNDIEYCILTEEINIIKEEMNNIYLKMEWLNTENQKIIYHRLHGLSADSHRLIICNCCIIQ